MALNIYRPVIKPNHHIVKFRRGDLLNALGQLDRSGAQEIGIEIQLDTKQ